MLKYSSRNIPCFEIETNSAEIYYSLLPDPCGLWLVVE